MNALEGRLCSIIPNLNGYDLLFFYDDTLPFSLAFLNSFKHFGFQT